MLDFLFDALQTLFNAIALNVVRVLAYPINPGERLFVIYLTTSFLMAAAVWKWTARRRASSDEEPVSLREFLFPSSIWRTASAWLDVRYFFFHQVFRVFLYGGFTLMVSDWTFGTTAHLLGTSPVGTEDDGTSGWLMALAYGFVSVAVLDLVAYVLHYCQHRFTILWEFHKVHHSARVMHPLTNYREHPVDNVLYALGVGTSMGVVTASVSALLGYVPAEPTVLGVGLFVLAYNGLGYNLRHSHIWLKWPGPLAYLFGSPAHHQVHHSYHPTHINKNFAFMFPMWDVIFGTYRMPETNADVKFGLSEREEDEFTSCLGIYMLPFRNVVQYLRR